MPFFQVLQVSFGGENESTKPLFPGVCVRGNKRTEREEVVPCH